MGRERYDRGVREIPRRVWVETVFWVAFALALRLVMIDGKLIDWDEGIAFDRARGGFNPYPYRPFYYVLLGGWMRIFGESLWAFRLPSALCSAASLGILFPLLSPPLTARGRRIFCALYALSPFDIYFAQYARPYTLAALFGVVAFALVARRRWAAAILPAILAVATHSSSIIPVTLLGLSALWLSRDRWSFARGAILIPLLLAVVAFGVYTGLGTVLRYSSDVPAWGSPAAFLRALPGRQGLGKTKEVLFLTLWGFRPLLEWLTSLQYLTILLALAAGGGLFVLARQEKRVFELTALLAADGVLAILGGLYLQNAYGFFDFNPRYTYPLFLILYFLFAWGCDGLARWRPRISLVPTALAVGATFTVAGWGLPTEGRRDVLALSAWPDIARAAEERMREDDLLVCGPGEWYCLHYYLHRDGANVPHVPYPGSFAEYRRPPTGRAEFDTWLARTPHREGIWFLGGMIDTYDSGIFRGFLRDEYDLLETVPIHAPEYGAPSVLEHYRIRRRAEPSSSGGN